MTYTPKGWTIEPPHWPVPWVATHEDYDASYEGPEDGWVGNGLCVTAPTRDGLLVEIARIEAESLPHLAGELE